MKNRFPTVPFCRNSSYPSRAFHKFNLPLTGFPGFFKVEVKRSDDLPP